MSKMLDDDFNESELFTNNTTMTPAEAMAAAPPPIPGGNPLAGYFRVPGLSIGLPTRGRYLPDGAITLDSQGKVEVYPMRSGDELLLKSPDALMSGIAIEKLIESCVPSIKTPSLVSAPDLDVLLLAIRAATYGNTMSVEVECPECDAELSFDCDLSHVLSTMNEIQDGLDVRLSDEVVVVLRPHTLGSQTRLLLAAYEEQRRALSLDAEVVGEEARQKILKKTYDRLAEFQTQAILDAIIKVAIPGQEVTDPAHIKEFIKNTNKDWHKKIETKVEEINMMGIDREVEACCKECKHEWKTMLEFNPATFFGQSS
jgi:hypothetical protein